MTEALKTGDAYFAAVVDLRGDIECSYSGGRVRPSVSFLVREKRIADWAVEHFDCGRVRIVPARNNSYAFNYSWQVRNAGKGSEVLRRIAPYLQGTQRRRAEGILSEYWGRRLEAAVQKEVRA